MSRPEILAPAGCLQRLKTAVAFGADAVYVGGTRFGLRKHADNLNEAELRAGIAHAHARGTKVYVTCNIMPLQRDWADFVPYARLLNDLRPDALIISDPGVAAHVREHTDLRIHVSTQASVTNVATAMTWRRRGASRIVVAREMSIEQCRQIREQAGIEVETFVHGAMCAAYSGKCVISNHTAGRDANRGGCVQTCRHLFTMHPGRSADADEPTATAPIMNARDLMALDLIPQVAAAGIDACKIEGRMKSPLYVAATVAAYRRAVDGTSDNPAREVLHQLSNRGYTTGALTKRMHADSINHAFEGYTGGITSLGQVHATDPQDGILVPIRTALRRGDPVCWLRPDGSVVSHVVEGLRDADGRPVDFLQTNRAGWIATPEPVERLAVGWLPVPGDHVHQVRRADGAVA